LEWVNFQNGPIKEGAPMVQQQVNDIGKSIEDRERDDRQMKHETKSMIGKPWKVVNSFSVYDEADRKRSDIQKKNDSVQVKVKRMSDGIYTVRIRPLDNPPQSKKKKIQKSKEDRVGQKRKNRERRIQKKA
jgi:hypothetical protein